MDDLTPDGRKVFLNVPFDKQYRPLLHAMICSVVCMGRIPVCALKISESATFQMEKVMALIRECRCSINDLSRMGSKNKLPRMNMPFEMGIAYALKQLSRQKENYQIFIFESKVHRIDRTLSDISGQKPKIHENNPKLVIRNIVMWLKLAVNPYPHPEPSQIFTVYERFRSKLPALVKKWYGEPAFDEMVAIAADLAAKQAILPDLYGRLGS